MMDIVNYYADLGIEDDHADEAHPKRTQTKEPQVSALMNDLEDGSYMELQPLVGV